MEQGSTAIKTTVTLKGKPVHHSTEAGTAFFPLPEFICQAPALLTVFVVMEMQGCNTAFAFKLCTLPCTLKVHACITASAWEMLRVQTFSN